MYNQFPQYLIRNYLFQACIVATLAYTLYFWFAIACNQPIGASNLTNGYFYGYFYHFPLWLLLYCFCGMFATALLKTYKLILYITLIIIIILFSIPIAFRLSSEYWDLVIPFFCIAIFLCSYTIFIHLRQKFNLKSRN